MPAKSGKQYRFMQMIAHGGKQVKGLSSQKAEEFIHATPKKKRKEFAKEVNRKK